MGASSAISKLSKDSSPAAAELGPRSGNVEPTAEGPLEAAADRSRPPALQPGDGHDDLVVLDAAVDLDGRARRAALLDVVGQLEEGRGPRDLGAVLALEEGGVVLRVGLLVARAARDRGQEGDPAMGEAVEVRGHD